MVKKTLLSLLLILVFSASTIGLTSIKAANSENNQVADNPLPYTDLTGEELIYEMGMGWNLGNTLDANADQMPNENCWSAPTTTKELVKSIHDNGYNTIRIPTTWGKMIDEETYEINPLWINRVQDVVDYAISMDMYVLLNMHHDGAENGGWIDLGINGDDWEAVKVKFAGAWTNIATKFKDYDEHLIFAGMNEVTTNKTSTPGSRIKINQLNQIFVDSVRQTGGNNNVRWLVVTSQYSTIGNLTNSEWVFPTDSYCAVDANRLMVENHYYGNSLDAPENLKSARDTVNKRAAAKGVTETVPMLLGEFGFVSGTTNDFGNIDSAYGFELTVRACKAYGITPVLWDTPGPGPNSMYDRTNNKPYDSSLRSWQAMARAMYTELTQADKNSDFSGVVKDPEIVQITSIDLSEKNITLKIGEKISIGCTILPADTNDVVIWNSDNDGIATVFRGIIRARGIGKTSLTVFSQSRSVEKTITVTVIPDEKDIKTTAITQDDMSIKKNEWAYLTPSVTPSNTEDVLSYKSSNSKIVTVNAVGKIYGFSEGSAYIIITASSGLSKTVKVTIKSVDAADSVDLVLSLMYNDSRWQNKVETGNKITINGNGTYTISFDINENLSAGAAAAGISDINSLVSVYIKDEAVSSGKKTLTPLDSAEIKYNRITVSNAAGDSRDLAIRTQEELEAAPDDYIKDDKVSPSYYNLKSDSVNVMTTDGYKKALKSGVFDSNDPINGWDGCIVEPDEVTIAHRSSYNPTVSFNNITSPTKIEIEFTLRNVVFSNSGTVEQNPAKSLTNKSSQNITVNRGNSAQVSVCMAAADSDSLVSFVSENSAVAIIDNNSIVKVDENGIATMDITTLATGITKITAMTDNGLSVEFTVNVIDKTALQTKYDDLKNTTQGSYSNASFTAFTEKLTSAKTVLDNENATQTEINTALADLNSAFGSLASLDKTALTSKYNELKTLSGTNYTKTSFAAFTIKLTSAKAALDNENATQTEIDTALSNLNTAYNSLVASDKTALKARYNEIKDTALDKYTKASKEALTEKLNATKTVIDNEDASQTEIDTALKDLNSAFDGLIKKSGCVSSSDSGTLFILILFLLSAVIILLYKKRLFKE